MQSFECTLGGRKLTIETGKLAEQAGGAVTVRYGDTVVLVTATVGRERDEGGMDFVPLTIDYEERLYAAGKIPGGFIRREGRPSEEAVLACRLADRPIRPLLPKEWRREIQIIATVLSADQENDPDVLAVTGAVAALLISDVPFSDPVAAIRIGYINNEFVVNPTLQQLDSSQLDLVVASTKEKIVMLEARAKELSEDLMPRAIKFGFEANLEVIKVLEQLRQCCTKPKPQLTKKEVNTELESAVASVLGDRLAPALSHSDKGPREEALDALKAELTAALKDKFAEEEALAVFEARSKAEVRKSILAGRRLTGRGLTEVRPISCEVGLLPRTHGSALFTRGQTQVLTITTLGSTREAQKLDGLGIEETRRFIHHYNFPPFSSGEVKRLGSTSRREIGHGALVDRALSAVLPSEEAFPYTIRLVSEVLSSSGSTSMGSTCAGSLALMDAGVPVSKAVSGIAMGLVTGEDGSYTILTDIEGLEDAYGDMDFKVAGTKDGVTALQMDIKIKGITLDMVDKIIAQSHDARMLILDKMNQALSAPRPEMSKYAPRMYKIQINPEKIGTVIGTGGKTIRSIIEETKTDIDIQDDGTVIIGSPDAAAAQKAIEIIENMTKEVEVGSIYTGKVSRLFDFGAMVEFLPGREGLVHISELADYRVGKVEDVVKVGDEVMVKVVGIDNQGRINLSRRATFEKISGLHGAGEKDAHAGPPRQDTQEPRRPFPFRDRRDSSDRPPRRDRPL